MLPRYLYQSPRSAAAPARACAGLLTRALAAALSFGALFVGLNGCKTAPAPAARPITPATTQTPAKPPIAAAPDREPLPAGGIKGIYMSGWVAGSKSRLQNLVGIVDRTEINAMVIDVKDDGQITYPVDVPLAREVAATGKMKGSMKMCVHIDRVLATLKAKKIFPIARIACFRDTPLAETHPEMAVHDASGHVWHDKKRHAWLNPYSKAAWDYNVDIALDAIKHGFKEIQFDYVRFPSEGALSNMKFPGKPENAKREDQIVAFMKYARDKIHAQGAWFAVDVFGLTSMVKDDEGIGQKFVKVIESVDYLCPMVYPSHYAKHEYKIPNPNAEPYKIVSLSVGDAKKRLNGSKTCELRPWLQDFTLGEPHYGPEQVKAQIKALNDLGIHEYLLWNPLNHYTEAALAKADSQSGTDATPKAAQRTAGQPPPADAKVGGAPPNGAMGK